MALKITSKEIQPRVYVISPEGPIDLETHIDLKNTIDPVINSAPKVLILDMTGLKLITSIGLSVIINTKRNLEEKGGVLILTNIPPNIRKTFDIIKTVLANNIYESMKDVNAFLATL